LNINKTLGAAVAAACMLSLTACSTARMGKGPVVSGTVGENVVQATAKVEAIDHETREVTLRGSDGEKLTFVADERVKNLAQVDVGDTVAATYYESVAFEVHKPGELSPGVAIAEGTGTAELGSKPAALDAQSVTVTSTIAAIDDSVPTVTLEGADGERSTIKVRNRENLKNVKVGDQVEITLTRALAIAVEELP